MCAPGPDIDPQILARTDGWRPLFGQTGWAQGHLRNQNVGPGDLFLFFWDLPARRREGGRVAVREAVAGAACPLGLVAGRRSTRRGFAAGDALPWARYHPHFRGNRGSNNLKRLPAAQAEHDSGSDGALARVATLLHELGLKGLGATGLRRSHDVALVCEWKRQRRAPSADESQLLSQNSPFCADTLKGARSIWLPLPFARGEKMR